MNIVQIGDKLRDMPISVLKSEDIIDILKKVNAVAPEGHQISAKSTGDDLYKLFNDSDAGVQSSLLEDLFSSRRESIILNTIIEENNKQNRKDDSTKKKWGSIQGSVLLIAAAFLLIIGWGFISQHGAKPDIPDAVIGNMVTQLLQHGVDMLLAYFEST